MQKTHYKNIKKLGLCIIAFEGTELLYNIISELRDSVDYVSLGLQKVSYHGDKMAVVDLNEIYRLRDEDKLIDNIVDIELDLNDEPRVQETQKRNLLIQDAEDNGCSHCIVIDSDEYYTRKSFEDACQEIDENDYEMTYCQYINYWHDYTHFLIYPFKQGMYVPFVSKVKYRHSFDCTDFTLPSDPTRRYVRPYKSIKKIDIGNGQTKEIKEYSVEYHVFPWQKVKMHHLSWLRADIRKKLNMWSSKTCFKNYNDLIDRAVYKYNDFKETDKTGIALMLFNTPGNVVDIGSFDKQYIHPKVDFRTRLRKVQDYKKLLVLSMSADLPLFNELEKTSNETWRNIDTEKYKNIDVEFWTYTDAKEGDKTHVDEDNHIIYIKRNFKTVDEAFNKTFSKTIYAINELKKLNIKYDYLIRTNNSTWLNIPLINYFLSWQNDDSLIFCGRTYSAFWSAFNVYGGGELMIFSKRNIDILLSAAKNPEEIENKVISCDDNIIFAIWNNRLLTLDLPQLNYIHSLEDNQDYLWNEINDEINFEQVAYQIKTYSSTEAGNNYDNRLIYDPQKMREIQRQWDNLENYDLEEKYNNLINNYYDKLIHVLPVSKNEWFSYPKEKKGVLKFKYTKTREEFPKYGNELQRKNGYKEIKFI